MADAQGFTCPRCGRTSYHPDDRRHGYCGACHDWTGTPERFAELPGQLALFGRGEPGG
jgi:anaerobic ribonucleoside-triphosphate reductase